MQVLLPLDFSGFGLRLLQQGEAMTEPSQLQRIENGELFTEDWVVECKSVTDGERCTTPATTWVAYHHAGACDHPSLDEDGCSTGWVCTHHLSELRQKAVRTVRYYNPNFLLKWWTSRRPFCLCGRPIQLESDVLQEVLPAWM